MEFISKSEKQTFNIAKNFAKNLKGGEILLLKGDLGAGKTAFTKGIADALEIKAIITSPTFTIMNEYKSGKLELYHFDMYRIENTDELKELGFEQYIGNPSGICCIEWFERTPELFLNKQATIIEIEKINENKRKIIINFRGNNEHANNKYSI